MAWGASFVEIISRMGVSCELTKRGGEEAKPLLMRLQQPPIKTLGTLVHGREDEININQRARSGKVIQHCRQLYRCRIQVQSRLVPDQSGIMAGAVSFYHRGPVQLAGGVSPDDSGLIHTAHDLLRVCVWQKTRGPNRQRQPLHGAHPYME